MRLSLERVAVALGDQRILDGATLSLAPGEFVALIGPNGAGKTTLMRAALGLLPVTDGSVRLNGRDPRRMSPRERARAAAYLPQTRPLAWPVSVRDAVALGRFAYGGPLLKLSPADQAAVDAALGACALAPLQRRAADTLSGGELARMHIARAFAAGAPLLLADEPIAALDPAHQWRIMDLIAGFAAKGGAALAVLHDMALAARFASRFVVMRGGRVLADGPPKDVLSADILAAAFDVKAEVGALGVAITGLT